MPSVYLPNGHRISIIPGGSQTFNANTEYQPTLISRLLSPNLRMNNRTGYLCPSAGTMIVSLGFQSASDPGTVTFRVYSRDPPSTSNSLTTPAATATTTPGGADTFSEAVCPGFAVVQGTKLAFTVEATQAPGLSQMVLTLRYA